MFWVKPEHPVCILVKEKNITVALDGTGGDQNRQGGIVKAVEFALTLYPALNLVVFGSMELKEKLEHGRFDRRRITFHQASQCIPQDEKARNVLEGYQHSAMRLAVEAVKNGEADACVSAGGTGPLVALSRHILGTIGSMRPALCARLPAGGFKRYALMLDMGANATSSAQDLHDFALLGTAAAKVLLNNEEPRTAILNIGTEQGKGNALVQETRRLIEKDQKLLSEGFLEANRLFCGDADIIVTDGFTGNVALKAAEGVASIFAHGPFFKRLLAKMSWPEWLIPWQYNGSLLLGVNGVVVKSHANAPEQALAVAMVEAAKAVSSGLYDSLRNDPILENKAL